MGDKSAFFFIILSDKSAVCLSLFYNSIRMSTDNQKKTLSPKEFANEYQVSVKTFMKWVYKIPNLIVSKPTRLFTPLQVKVIREHLG